MNKVQLSRNNFIELYFVLMNFKLRVWIIYKEMREIVWNRIFVFERILFLNSIFFNESYNSEILESLGNIRNWVQFAKCKEITSIQRSMEFNSTRRTRRIYFNLKDSSIQYKEFNSIQMQIIQSNSILHNLIASNNYYICRNIIEKK